MSDSRSNSHSEPSPAEAAPTNQLGAETSAYLRQHMNNPVHWQPWGAGASERAGREDRPLLVSIGYSACHWCHVMERESFEDLETARLMNEGFVCVKVDREERPDVDQIYMDTVTALTGHGGWPLTVFCHPDGRPFYAGTYYPPEPRQGMPSFRQVLEAVRRTWEERREDVVATANQIVEALSARPKELSAGVSGSASLELAGTRLLQRADSEHGGFGTAPKFPAPTSLDALLAAADVLPERKAAEALEHVALTCREMACGGVYDQLGGGFHRYSVDDHWGVPHFEKMLYDQGQLIQTYLEVWRRLGRIDDDLLWPVRETVDYLRRDMAAGDGSFFASQDADSAGQEGSFYVWSPAEVEELLDPEVGGNFCDAYAITPSGNFDNGTSVLGDRRRAPRETLAAQRAILLEARGRRIAPDTDRKRVASWIAYTISGLTRAGSLLNDESMLRDARTAAEFVLERMTDAQGRLLRVYNEGRAHVPAFLDDVAGMLQATLDLHRAGAGDNFAVRALELAEDLAQRFYDVELGDLFLAPSDGETLAIRPRSDHDGATPHSAGLALLGLLRIGSLAGRQDLVDLAKRVLDTHAFDLESTPEALPTLARAACLAEREPSTLVIVGSPDTPQARALADCARKILNPEDAIIVHDPAAAMPPAIGASWLSGRDARGGEPTAYLCRGTSCSAPLVTPHQLVSELVSTRDASRPVPGGMPSHAEGA